MQRAEVQFDNDENGRKECAKFKRRLANPKFVIECLEKHRRWRKGKGEYEYSGDPEKERPIPYSAEALSMIEDSAIRMLGEYSKIRSCRAADKGKCRCGR